MKDSNGKLPFQNMRFCYNSDTMYVNMSGLCNAGFRLYYVEHKFVSTPINSPFSGGCHSCIKVIPAIMQMLLISVGFMFMQYLLQKGYFNDLKHPKC